MSKHLGPAMLKLSPKPAEHRIYGFMGWTQHNGKWTYVSPDAAISADGLLAQPPEVELEQRLRDYGVAQADWSNCMSAFAAAVAALPKALAPALISFALLPLVQRFFPAAAPKPALHLVGTTGSGKSEIAALLTNFYGSFTRDTPPAQWGDTVNTVETLGYTLADALYWVDDYKSCYADERTFTRFLQSYSRGMGRGRLTREAKLRQERPCRGLLLSTGETTIEGEASVLARMIVLEVPPWERRDPAGDALSRAQAMRGHLGGFTTEFARWTAGRADTGEMQADLAGRFPALVKGYQQRLAVQIGQQPSSGRMVHNWAVLLSVYQLLREFLTFYGAEDVLPAWSDTLPDSVRTVQQERAGSIFLGLLSQQIASGQVMLATNLRTPEDPRPNCTLIGYRDGEYVYLLPEVTYQAVTRVQPLKFSTAAIGAQLREDGTLIPGANCLTVQRRIRQMTTRVWQLKVAALGCDEEEM